MPGRLCKYHFDRETYTNGCIKGDTCTFLHVEEPGALPYYQTPKSTDKVCKFNQNGSCIKGDKCKFIHPQDTETKMSPEPETEPEPEQEPFQHIPIVLPCYWFRTQTGCLDPMCPNMHIDLATERFILFTQQVIQMGCIPPILDETQLL